MIDILLFRWWPLPHVSPWTLWTLPSTRNGPPPELQDTHVPSGLQGKVCNTIGVLHNVNSMLHNVNSMLHNVNSMIQNVNLMLQNVSLVVFSCRLELELERDKRERDAREREIREREIRDMEMREKMEMKAPGKLLMWTEGWCYKSWNFCEYLLKSSTESENTIYARRYCLHLI